MTEHQEAPRFEEDDDPNDPHHPDHDLSEAAPVWLDAADVRPWFIKRGFVIVVALIVILGLLVPSLRIIF